MPPGPDPTRRAGRSAPVRAVLLDFGGTLVGGAPEPYRGWRDVFEARGIPIDPARYERANTIALGRLGSLQYRLLGASPTFWDRVHAATLVELGVEDPDGALVVALRAWATSPEQHPPFPEARSTVLALRRAGLTVHVLSNNTDYLTESLERLGWVGLFDSVTYSQEAGAEKPDPRVSRFALRRAGTDPGETVHVGDSWVADHEGATGAGLRAVWLSRDRKPAPRPATVIHRLDELPGLLAR